MYLLLRNRKCNIIVENFEEKADCRMQHFKSKLFLVSTQLQAGSLPLVLCGYKSAKVPSAVLVKVIKSDNFFLGVAIPPVLPQSHINLSML